VGKRLFLAVELDEATRIAVDDLSHQLRQDLRIQSVGRTSWVSRDRMHLTLHFAGDADAAAERRLLDALAIPIPCSPFRLGFHGLGVFPERGSPRVLWLGIGDGLDDLLAVRRELTRRLGTTPGRPEAFHPHLTLARFRDRVPRGRLGEMSAFPVAAGPSPIDRVTLYESRLSPKGPAYAALAEAPLKAMP
jgi:2'-5' RNA ligase